MRVRLPVVLVTVAGVYVCLLLLRGGAGGKEPAEGPQGKAQLLMGARGAPAATVDASEEAGIADAALRLARVFEELRSVAEQRLTPPVTHPGGADTGAPAQDSAHALLERARAQLDAVNALTLPAEAHAPAADAALPPGHGALALVPPPPPRAAHSPGGWRSRPEFADLCRAYPKACTCEPVDGPLLFYNRVPKCASGSTAVFMEHAQLSTGFEHCRDTNYLRHYMSRKEARSYAQSPTVRACHKRRSEGKRMVINAHLFYLNFTELGGQQPLYMNVIREPVSRCESLYYFERDARGTFPAKLTFEACFKNGPCQLNAGAGSGYSRKQKLMESCSTNYLTRWFCGMQPVCNSGGRAMLEEAKRVMAQEYTLVGVMKHLSHSFDIARKLFPHYFGVPPKEQEICNKCGHERPPPMSDGMRKAVTDRNPLDVELYDFSLLLLRAKSLACDMPLQDDAVGERQ